MAQHKLRDTDTRPQEAIGMSRVSIIVQGRGRHGWQPRDQINDDGVDGVIMKRKNGRDTGEIFHVQVKCGSGNGYFKATSKRPKHFGVIVGDKYIVNHRPKWNALPGPIILVYVDSRTEKAWWADLKDDSSYTQDNKSIILVPKDQRFGVHSFAKFKNLNGNLHINPELAVITATKEDVSYFNLTKDSLKDSAKEFYKRWSLSDERTNPALGDIIVSREGWRHLSRRRKPAERIIQSWLLLGIAKKMILTIDKTYQQRRGKRNKNDSPIDKLGNYVLIDYISLRAQVLFPHRHGSVVQVILKRKRRFNSLNSVVENKIFFYSVFETLSGKKIR